MKIAVYSGSFNPLHIGHKAIIEYLTERMGFDDVYLVVSPQNPLKEICEDPTGMKRQCAAKEAVIKHGLRAKVDDIEIGMPAPHYTIRTLDALKSREPQNDFNLVIGADNISIIRKWKDYKRILTDYGVIVYPRKGYDCPRIIDSLMSECNLERQYRYGTGNRYNIFFAADAPVIDISSTEIRNGLNSGKDMSGVML